MKKVDEFFERNRYTKEKAEIEDTPVAYVAKSGHPASVGGLCANYKELGELETKYWLLVYKK